MTNKTIPTGRSVGAFIAAVENERRRTDAQALDVLFRDVTGFEPQMWGDSIVGYGRYHYRYGSGREGDYLATGFSPRKSNLSIYVMPGYADHDKLLARLGKHKTGAACLYVNTLADINQRALRALIAAGLKDLERQWSVFPV